MWKVGFAAGLFLVGCGPKAPPAMLPASAEAMEQGTSVVFVRARTACDTSDHITVIDDGGRFVANLTPGTRSAARLQPGTHVFYAWENRDLRWESHPEWNPVGAVRVVVPEGDTKFVAVHVNNARDASVTRCWAYAPVEMHAIASPDASVADTDPLVPRQADGQAMLDEAPVTLQSHVELGRRKLREIDAARERNARRELESAERANRR
jgi:hypothetical protein